MVNNIYLDSASRRDYHEHINGTANRAKTRVRWYGPEFETAPRPVLERKLKRGLVSGKTGHRLPDFAVNGGCLRSLIASHFETAELPSALRLALQHMEPSLLNRYRRRYFLSRDGRFRLTVDSELQFAGLRPDGRRTAFPAVCSDLIVIELKFAPEFDASHVTNSFPFRVQRFSKYIAGIQTM